MALCSGWHLLSSLDNGSDYNEILQAMHNVKLSALCNLMRRSEQGMKFLWVRRGLPDTTDIIVSFQWQFYLKLFSAVKEHHRKEIWFRAVAKVWYVTLRHGRTDVKRLQNDTTRWTFTEGVTLFWALTLYWGYFTLLLRVLDLILRVLWPFTEGTWFIVTILFGVYLVLWLF